MKKTTVAIQMRGHAAEQRQEIAKQVLDRKTVYAAIKNAATAGQTDVRIIQTVPVDLSGTAYAEGLTKQLLKDGFLLHWQDAVRKELHKDEASGQTLETGHLFRFKELFISWSSDAIIKSPRQVAVAE